MGRSDEFIREVDEEVRRDRMMGLWKRYGTLAIAVAVAIVLGTAGGVAWRTWQESQRIEQARQFDRAEQLFAAGDYEAAAERYAELADATTRGYGVLARLREAEALSRAGDEEGARRALEQLAGAGAVDPLYRDLGGLVATLRALDELDPAEARARFEELAAPDHPWRYSARELKALAQLEAGEVDAARQTLEELVADAGTPPPLRRRARELLEALGYPQENEASS
jgi:hypothetical protein